MSAHPIILQHLSTYRFGFRAKRLRMLTAVLPNHPGVVKLLPPRSFASCTHENGDAILPALESWVLKNPAATETHLGLRYIHIHFISRHMTLNHLERRSQALQSSLSLAAQGGLGPITGSIFSYESLVIGSSPENLFHSPLTRSARNPGKQILRLQT